MGRFSHYILLFCDSDFKPYSLKRGESEVRTVVQSLNCHFLSSTFEMADLFTDHLTDLKECSTFASSTRRTSSRRFRRFETCRRRFSASRPPPRAGDIHTETGFLSSRRFDIQNRSRSRWSGWRWGGGRWPRRGGSRTRADREASWAAWTPSRLRRCP